MSAGTILLIEDEDDIADLLKISSRRDSNSSMLRQVSWDSFDSRNAIRGWC